MVSLGSLAVFLITILALGFSPTYTWFDDSHVDVSKAQYQIQTGIVLTDDDNYNYHKNSHYNSNSDFIHWQDKKKKKEGVTKRKWVFSNMFKNLRGLDANNNPIMETNWLGIISLFNIIFCFVGFFLFKDK